MAKANQKLHNLPISSISTILGKETEFNGILKFKKSLQVNGYFHGEIESEGFLVIAPGAAQVVGELLHESAGDRQAVSCPRTPVTLNQ